MSDEPGRARDGQREAAGSSAGCDGGEGRVDRHAARGAGRRAGAEAAALAAAGEAGASAGMHSSDSGDAVSKERIGAKEARRARRQESERERGKDRRRGVQRGHPRVAAASLRPSARSPPAAATAASSGLPRGAQGLAGCSRCGGAGTMCLVACAGRGTASRSD